MSNMNLLKKRIFIVEDNASNSTIMKILLQASGAVVFNDRFAINTLERIHDAGAIDLIIMDLMLSNHVSGYDVYDQIKQDPTLSAIPAVVVSASDPALELNKARNKGFVGYITKPINNQTFSRMIASILEGKQVWADDFSEFEHQ